MQLINTDIKVHMACPGFVNTSMIRNAQKKAVRCTTLHALEPSERGPFHGATSVMAYWWELLVQYGQSCSQDRPVA